MIVPSYLSQKLSEASILNKKGNQAKFKLTVDNNAVISLGCNHHAYIEWAQVKYVIIYG